MHRNFLEWVGAVRRIFANTGREPRAGRASRPAETAGAWPFVLWIFVFSRLLFLGTGALASAFLPRADLPLDLFDPPGLLANWAHWDGVWYAQIAAFGYDLRAPESTAFFPLYPLILRFGVLFGEGPILFGVLVSLAAALLALTFVYRIAEEIYDVRAARATTLALAFFPTAFFMNAVYSEALFLALATGSIWAARVRRNLLLAGALGSLAAATRSPGVLLLVPLLFEWARRRREFGRRGLAALCLVPGGMAAYMAFLWARFGDPLLFVSQQGAWGRRFVDPLLTLELAAGSAGKGIRYVLEPAKLFVGGGEYSFYFSNAVGLAVLVVALFLLGAGFAGLPPGLSLYALLVILQPLLAPVPDRPLLSLPRLVLGAFPLFLILGVLLSRGRHHGLGLALWISASIVCGVALTALFVTWRWVA